MQKYEAMVTSPHQPERVLRTPQMTDIFPIESISQRMYLHGPISLPMSKDLFKMIIPVCCQSQILESDARWNVVRLGRAAQSPLQTGFEGYVVADQDPAKTLCDISKTHVAYAFENSGNYQQPSKTLARKERSIRALIDKLRQHGSLSQEELEMGNRLMGMLIAKLKAHEGMLHHKGSQSKKLNEFRRVTQQHVRQARPAITVEGTEDTPTALHWSWQKAPQTIQPDVQIPVMHLAEEDQLVLELLSELGRFGNPLVREYLKVQRIIGPLR